MSIDQNKSDDKAFIFTLKNPHGVDPTRFMKIEGSSYVICCRPHYGPIFSDGEKSGTDILIGDDFYQERSCTIGNDGTGGYECHPQYKKSLFVNSAKSNDNNYFSVLDLEVYYMIDYYIEYISDTCMYPNIIWNYIETKNISDESLKQFDDDIELLKDLDAIHCNDSNIRLKISNYYLKNPSQFLPDTQIVDQQYDSYLREWIGDYDMKLLYRASEHGYTARSFHDYCDDKGPTLVIIKSSGGWIFGGYTTQSWSGNSIY